MSKKYDEHVKLAQNGTLPADFDQWGLVNANGRTVAHYAAHYGNLPDNFSQWNLTDKHGWTVAHTAAWTGHLPEDFDQWGLANSTDINGLAVLSHFLRSPHSDRYLSRWKTEKPLCKTDADWEVFKVVLPEIYQKYSISECMLDVDNDQEAML
jgi:ankyrin repeat protein